VSWESFALVFRNAYHAAYAGEMAWREDARRISKRSILSIVINAGAQRFQRIPPPRE